MKEIPYQPFLDKGKKIQQQAITTIKKHPIITTIVGIISILLFILLLLLIQLYFTLQTVQSQPLHSPSQTQPVSLIAPLKQHEKEKQPLLTNEEGITTILLIGTGDEGHPGNTLTDTIILASIDHKKKSVGLLSVPRDLYLTIPELEASTKINAVAHLGEQKLGEKEGIPLLVRTLESLTGETIQYFVQIDFQAFITLADTLGGIDITLEEDIDDPYYPGPNYSYDPFIIKKGSHHVDGATALKIARSRYTTKEGDFGRAQRQHLIINGLQQALLSYDSINLKIGKTILQTLENHLKTNFTITEMISATQYLQEIDQYTLESKVIKETEPWPILKSGYTPNGMFILQPQLGHHNTLEIHYLAQQSRISEDIIKQQEQILKKRAMPIIIEHSPHNVKKAEQIRAFLTKKGLTTTIQQNTNPKPNTILYSDQQKQEESLLQLILPALVIQHHNEKALRLIIQD